ncbi:MAG: universal stress protein [Pyrinomonadaceae bacterium]|nr:universal stress protein [Pyrinomonadaceae bacterium]
MRILLAVDSITTAEMMIKAVASRPWATGTRARVISVVEDTDMPQEVWREAGYNRAALRKEMHRRGEQIAGLMAEPLKRCGINVDIAVMRGDPAWLITDEARIWPADSILIRAHNRTDFRNWMLGSVAKSVIRNAPCSVEVVRAPGEDQSVLSNGHMKILLATDGSEHSDVAVRSIAGRPWPEGTEVKVMSIVNPLVYSLEEIGLYQGRGTEKAHRAIGDATHILKGAGVQLSGEVIAGRPDQRIINEAKNWGG